MPHLKLEVLARLVDEAPDPVERAHLDACVACQDELAALRDQTESLSLLPELMPPPDAWPAVQRRLRAEKLSRRGPRWRPGPAALRTAAAIVLFMAGGAMGYAVRGPIDGGADTVAAAGSPAAPATAGQEVALSAEEPVVGDAESPASLSLEVERTEEMFASALDRYMRASGTDAPDPAARLAALDNIVLTTAEALHAAPADPVINSYHLTAVAQRRELLRQLATPADWSH
jgi:hypothetical protein